MALTLEETRRYLRHLRLPEVGQAGQAAFGAARVLIVGAGGLGSPASMYLAAAGVGTLGLVDHDTVDETNLQRQILYRGDDVGRPKLAAAADTLRGINPLVTVQPIDAWLNRDNALAVLADYDIVLNGCDNFPTRYLVNDACVLLGKPCVDGSLYRFEGQLTVYDTANGGPCYRCRFPEPPPPGMVPSCAEAGILGAVAGVIGCLQAVETLKLILRGAGTVAGPDLAPLIGRVLVLDVLTMETLTLRYRRNPDCPICGDTPTITELIDYDAFCGGQPETSEAMQQRPQDEIGAVELAERLAGGEELVLVDVRQPEEWALCRLDGAVLVPLPELDTRLDELPRDRPLITYCHAGVRSLTALRRLKAQGFDDVRSLRGGIDAWSREVDPSVPRY